MNWKKLLSAGLVLIMGVSLIGCELVTVNTEKDNSQIVLKVNEKEYTKKEINDIVDKGLAAQGVKDTSSPQMQEALNDYRKKILEALAKNEVLKQEAISKGFKEKLTEEDMKKLEEDYQKAVKYYETDIKQQKEQEFAEDPDKDSKIAKAVEDDQKTFLENNEISSIEEYKNTLMESKAVELFEEELKKDISISDEDLQAEFQKLLNEQKGNFDNNPAEYIKKSQDDTAVVVYTPEGVRYVKHILIKISDEDSSAISELQTQKTTAESSGDTQKAAEIQTQIDAKKTEAFAKIQSKADSALKRAKSGENFDKLVAELGEDPGMKDNNKGYAMHEKATGIYDEAFQNAGMALSKPGEISGLVPSSFGYHIILFASEAQAGEVSFESVRQAILDMLLKSKKENVIEDAGKNLLEEYEKEGKVKMYPDMLKPAKVPGK